VEEQRLVISIQAHSVETVVFSLLNLWTINGKDGPWNRDKRQRDNKSFILTALVDIVAYVRFLLKWWIVCLLTYILAINTENLASAKPEIA
jgi:hypothetical protein